MNIALLSIIAGIGGTGAGGLLIVLIGKRSPSMICSTLSFAGGVMTSIVCFGLIPESIELSGLMTTILGLIAGAIVIMLLNKLIDRLTELKGEKLKIHATVDELYHEKELLDHRKSFIKSGILMITAIALHNIPEGIAIGASNSYDPQFGFLLAIIIALHNIPEGMAIASPLLAGGMKYRTIVLLTALSGAPTIIGGMLGALMGAISDTAISVALSAAGGAMLYVVFGEIIPQSIIMTKNRIVTISSLFGVIIGLMMTQMQ